MVQSEKSQLVGRLPELAHIAETLDRCDSGQFSVVAVSGNAGLGKSALLNELCDRATERGALVVRGFCRDTEGAPALWPWVEALRHANRARPETSTPVIVQGLTESSAGPGASEPASLFELQDSVATYLKTLCETQPVVVAIEDVHWADDSSLGLLGALPASLDSSPVLIAFTTRPPASESSPGRLREVLADLTRNPDFSELRLDGLSFRETVELIGTATKWAVPPDLVGVIHRRTDGNPYFIKECLKVVETMIDHDFMGAPGGTTTATYKFDVPDTIQGLLAQRIETLPPESGELLVAAAIVGRQFSLRVLSRTAGVEDHLELLDKLGHATDSGLIEPLGVGMSEFRFVHALVREALLTRPRPAERVRLHAAAAKAIETVHGTDSTEHASALAYHYAEAATLTGTEPAVHFGVKAAEQAIGVKGYSEAVEIISRALEVAEGVGLQSEDPGAPVANESIAELLFMQARALWQVMHVTGMSNPPVIVPILRAFNYYLDQDDHSNAVRIATLPVGFNQGQTELVRRMFHQALEIVTPGSAEESMLRSRYGQNLSAEQPTDRDEAIAQFDRALEIARSAGAFNARSWANSRRLNAFINRGMFKEIGLSLAEAEAAADEVEDPEAEADLRFHLTHASLQQFRLKEARYHAERCNEAIDRSRAPGREFMGHYANHSCAALAGDYEAAARWPTERVRGLASNVMLASHMLSMGDHNEGVDMLAEAMREFQPPPASAEAVRKWGGAASNLSHCLLMMPGLDAIPQSFRTDYKKALLTIWSPDWSEDMPSGIWKMARVIDMTLLDWAMGDSERADDEFRYLRHYSGYADSGWGGLEVSLDRVIALAATIAGDLDAAEHHYRLVIELAGKAGFVRDHGWSALEYARLLVDNPKRAEAAKVTELLRTAREAADTMGSTLLRENAISLQEAVEKSISFARPKRPDGLTTRELQVLGQLAHGRSNREIAEALFISQNTVIRHVSNIMAKTGSANRTEAGVYAERHGLVQPYGEANQN